MSLIVTERVGTDPEGYNHSARLVRYRAWINAVAIFI